MPDLCLSGLYCTLCLVVCCDCWHNFHAAAAAADGDDDANISITCILARCIETGMHM